VAMSTRGEKKGKGSREGERKTNPACFPRSGKGKKRIKKKKNSSSGRLCD